MRAFNCGAQRPCQRPQVPARDDPARMRAGGEFKTSNRPQGELAIVTSTRSMAQSRVRRYGARRCPATTHCDAPVPGTPGHRQRHQAPRSLQGSGGVHGMDPGGAGGGWTRPTKPPATPSALDVPTGAIATRAGAQPRRPCHAPTFRRACLVEGATAAVQRTRPAAALPYRQRGVPCRPPRDANEGSSLP